MRTKSRRIPEPPPADFNEVKRRFIRQNRELARANSNQSLRIRSLEIENSRLLDEILRLRERNLWLERERQDAQVNASSEAIRRIKDELQAKFAELSGFVDGMAETRDVGSDQDFLLPKERLLSPSQRQYRERQPLTELMQDCIMPTITEDRVHPRQSLDADDVRIIRLSDHSSNGSPDLGPPPVARLECADAVPVNPPTAPQETPATNVPEAGHEEGILAASLSINLETRRKKRESLGRLDIRRRSMVAQPSDTSDTEMGTTMHRIGAKRKLADCDPEKPIKLPPKDDFTFSRKAAVMVHPETANAQPSSDDIPKHDGILPEDDSAEPSSPPRLARRVLANKSTNMSPRKAQPLTAKIGKGGIEKATAPKLNISRQRAQSRSRRISSVPLIDTADEVPPVVEILPIDLPAADSVMDLPPKTPAAIDLFSPSTSEPSVKQHMERGDTPPPTDLSSVSNTTEGGQRPSRRARSAVNYTEPSLVAKMRRPGKEMVDAISGLQGSRRSISSAGARKSHGSASLSISQEPDTTGAERTNEALARTSPWSSFDNPHRGDIDPGSPLHSRTTTTGLPSATSNSCSSRSPEAAAATATEVDAGERAEDAPQPPSTAAASAERSGSSTAIAALIASSRRRRESSCASAPTVAFDLTSSTSLPARGEKEEAARRIEEMNLYEFQESSSSPSQQTAAATGEEEEDEGDVRKRAAPPTQRESGSSQRRHSVVSRNAGATGLTNGVGPIRSERTSSRRRRTLI